MLRLHVKTEFPQPRHIEQAVLQMKGGALAIYPTDTTYGLGCDIYSKRSIDRIYRLKGLPSSHPLTFICTDLAQVARYAYIDNLTYKILRHHTPGPYTFILKATKEVPRLLQSKRQTVGIRIPSSKVCLALAEALGHPIINTTVSLPHDDDGAYWNEPDDIAKYFAKTVDVLLDGGSLYEQPSSVVDLSSGEAVIVREGAGDLSWLSDN